MDLDASAVKDGQKEENKSSESQKNRGSDKQKFILESIFLLVIFGILLWMGLGAYYEHQLDYDFPKGFMATDSFYKYDRAVYLDETGDNQHTPTYLTGGVENIEELYPFVSYQILILFKDASGLKLFNSQYLLNVLYAILGGLLVYLMVKKYHPRVALLSLGTYGFLFVDKFYTGYLFGWWPQIVGSLLLIGAVYAALNFEKKGFHILLAIILASAFLAHTPEAMFAGVFSFVVIIADFIKEKYDWKILKKGIVAFIVFIPLVLYYLPIFVESFLLKGASGSISFTPKAMTFPAPAFSDFRFYGILIIIGIMAMAALLVKNKGREWKHFGLAILMGLITYSALIGINERVYQNRFFWPIYFGIFFGLGAYSLIKLTKIKMPNIIYYLIPLCLIAITLFSYFQPPAGPGLIPNKEMWDGIQWIRNNVPAEEKALVFYGDSYNQHGIYSAFGHIMYNNDWNYLPNNIGYDISESLAKIQKGEVTRNYTSRPFIHHQILPTRVSWLKLEYVDVWKQVGLNYEKVDGKGRGFESRDLCSFDNVIFDKYSRFPGLAEYNLKVRAELLKKDFVKEVFSNGWYSILKNNKTGTECVKSGAAVV